MNVRSLMIAVPLSLMSPYAAIAENFEPYQLTPDGPLQDVATYEFQHDDNFVEKDIVTSTGRRLRIAGFRFQRSTSVYMGVQQLDFKASVIFYDLDRAEAEYEREKRAKPDQAIPMSYREESANFSIVIADPHNISTNPCAAERNICSQTNFKLAESKEKSDPRYRYIYRLNELRIKSIDYNWATNEWNRVVIAETLYTERASVPGTIGSRTVGN